MLDYPAFHMRKRVPYQVSGRPDEKGQADHQEPAQGKQGIRASIPPKALLVAIGEQCQQGALEKKVKPAEQQKPDWKVIVKQPQQRV